MNLKRVIKWIGYIIGIIVVLYILILGVLIYFLASGDFKNSLIYLSDLQESDYIMAMKTVRLLIM